MKPYSKAIAGVLVTGVSSLLVYLQAGNSLNLTGVLIAVCTGIVGGGVVYAAPKNAVK